MKNNIKDLLPPVLTEALGEEKLAKLQDEFTQLVESKVQERIELAKECERAAFNENANAMVEELVVQMNQAYCKTFLEAYNAICDDAERTISSVKRYYNQEIKRESNKFKKQLVENISNHISEQVDSILPTKFIRKAMKNVAATRVLESLKQMLAVDEAAANDAIRKPVIESANFIAKQGKEIKRLTEENNALLEKIDESAKDAFLNEKMHSLHLNEDAINFVRKTIGSRDLKYLSENFDYAMGQYKDSQSKARAALAQKTMNERMQKRTQLSRAQIVESKKPVAQKPEQQPKTLDESFAQQVMRSVRSK